MTENEAIKRVEEFGLHHAIGELPHSVLTVKAFKMAIKALEEIQQYRAIGTVEECREAMEKQFSKRPNREGDGYADGEIVYDTWICPCCGKRYEVDYDDYDYCPNCGQKIDPVVDWSDIYG